MANSRIKITGLSHTAPRVGKNGDAVLMFKIPSHEPVSNKKDLFNNTFYKVFIKKELWKNISKKTSENTYYVIEGEVRASLTSNGAPFVSVLCSSIRAINGLTKDEESNLEAFKLYGNLPVGTDEVIPIDSIHVPENLTKPRSALNAAYKFFERNGTFQNPLKIDPDSMNLVAGYAEYMVAKDLNIKKVPVTYYLNSRGEAPDEIKIKNIPWFDPEDVTEISVKDVTLTEDIHLKVRDFVFNIDLNNVHETRKISVPIAVRPLDNGKYSLVMGAARYFAAKILDIEKIPAIITDMTHDEFVNSKLIPSKAATKKNCPKAGRKKIQGETELSSITIPKKFLATQPKREKIDATIAYYKKNGKFDKPVVIVGDENLLVDGYKRYVAAKELNLPTIWTIKIV